MLTLADLLDIDVIVLVGVEQGVERELRLSVEDANDGGRALGEYPQAEHDRVGVVLVDGLLDETGGLAEVQYARHDEHGLADEAILLERVALRQLDVLERQLGERARQRRGDEEVALQQEAAEGRPLVQIVGILAAAA